MPFSTKTMEPSTSNRAWLTGNQLKYFAALLMVFAHLNDYILRDQGWLGKFGGWVEPIVAPIFIYMCAEGFYYTRNRKKYMLLLFACFEAMHVLRLVCFGILKLIGYPDPFFYVPGNNIFGAMFMVTVLLCFVELIRKGVKDKKYGKAVLGAGLILAVFVISFGIGKLNELTWNAQNEAAFEAISFIPNLHVEGGWTYITLGALFYVLRRRRFAQMASIAVLALYQSGFMAIFFGFPELFKWQMGSHVIFAAVLLFFYNGKRGRGVSPKFDKWFFYLFYPAHIYLLFIIARVLQI